MNLQSLKAHPLPSKAVDEICITVSKGVVTILVYYI